MLEQAGIRISMDGRGRCLDNISTERLWRSVKYENVFPSSYQNLEEAQAGLEQYFNLRPKPERGMTRQHGREHGCKHECLPYNSWRLP